MKNTKSLLAILLACMMIVSCLVITPVAATGPVDEWDGTTDTSWYNDVDTTFTLTSAEQLAGLAEIVNSGSETFSGKTILLDIDVRLNSTSDIANFANWASSAPANPWTPIGYYDVGSFRGTFNGQGHTISGMYTEGSSFGGRPALFGWVNGATIRNFTIEYSFASGTNCTSIVAAFHSSTAPAFYDITISNCVSNGVSDGTALLMGKMGGFATLNISNVDVVASTINCTYWGGALLGYLSGGSMTAINIDDCDVEVTLNTTYTDDRGSGGLIGALGQCKNPSVSNLTTLSITDTTVDTTAVAKRDAAGVIGVTYLNTLGTATFENVDVDVDIDCHDSAANIADIAAVIGYLRVFTVSNKILFKDMTVSGTMKLGQNSGILIGRINAYGSGFTGIAEIEVDNVTSDLDIYLKRGTGNAQCNGGIIGLGQNAVTTLTVDAYNSSNNWIYISAADYATGSAQVGGIIGSATVTNVTVTNSNVADNFYDINNYASGYIADGKVTNATFTNCTYTGTIDCAGSYYGGFAGRINPTVSAGNIGNYSFTNCVVSSDISGSSINGGMVAYYDPSSGNATADATGGYSGQFSFTNCLVRGAITSTSSIAGGLIGRIYPKNVAIDIDNVIISGGADSPSKVGAIVGECATANVLDNYININNFYFTAGVLATTFNAEGYNPVDTCVFWTPSTAVQPNDLVKQSNATIQTFLDATSGLNFAAKFTHSCSPVKIEDGKYLICEVPGCADYRIDTSIPDVDEWDGTSNNSSWRVLQNDGCYHITTAEQLANLAAQINSGCGQPFVASTNYFQDKTIKLDADLRLNSSSDIANFNNWGTSAPANTWSGIGTYDSAQNRFHSFNGTFDGQGHTISGMYCAPTATTHGGTRYALFGIPGELVQIKDLTIDRAYVKGAGNGLGILMGQMANTHSNKPDQTVAKDITVSNSYVRSTASGGLGVILGRTAGLVGQTIVFDNCDVNDTEIVAPAYAGGIFGFHGSGDLGGITFTGCDLTDNTFRADQNVGGIMGGSYTLAASSNAVITIDDCHADNRIVITSVTAGNQSGGFIGYLQSPPKSIVIEDSSVAGDIDVLQNSGTMIGRIGNSRANANISITVTNCVSSANLTSNVMHESANSQCLGVVVGLIQTTDGTNISSITIDGLTCSGTFDGTLKGGNSMGIIGSINPVTTTLSVSNVDSTLDLLGVGSGIGGVAGVSGEVLTATFTNVDISGTLTGSDGVAGIVGRSKMFDATFTNCSFTGSAEGNQYVGGLIGDTYAYLDVYVDPAGEPLEFNPTLANNVDYSFINCTVDADLTAATRNVGGIIGDYDPDYGNAAGEHFGSAGALSFTNCVVSGTRTATTVNAGGLVGRIYPTNVSVTVDGSTVLGETASSDASSGAITGCIGSAAGADDLYDIDGFFYSGMSDPKLVPTWNDGGYGVIIGCDYFTADEDATPDVVPESNAAAGAPTAHITNAPAIAETLGGSIREGANPGLRFGFRMDADLRVGEGESVNMGVIMIPASMLVGELTLNTPNIATAKAIRTFGASNPNYIAGSETFTAVLTGIPESKKDVQITARAYVQIGTVVYYSATQTASYNQIAALIP